MKDIKDLLYKNASSVNEDALINNDEELQDYAEKLLKEAHGDKYDAKLAKKTLNDLKKKYKKDGKPDYTTIVGVLQNSLDEAVKCIQHTDNRINETLKQFIGKSIDESLTAYGDGVQVDMFKTTASFSIFLELCEKAEALVALSKLWNEQNQETVVSREITLRMHHVERIINKAYALSTRIPNISKLIEPVQIDITAEEVSNKKLAPIIKKTDEWKELLKSIDKLEETFAHPSMLLELRAIMLLFMDYFEQLREILKS